MASPKWLIVRAAALLMISIACATSAAAQSHPQPRVEISANFGVQTASKFTELHDLPSNGGETETITVDHGAKAAFAFDIGAAVRLMPRLSLGVYYEGTEMKDNASITATIPHPISFKTPRQVEGSLDGAAHNEQNVHVDLMYALPIHAVN